MLRIALGVIAGFITWMILWLGTEKTLSAVFPEWYGAPQLAFQQAIENGGQFTAETRLLLSHIFLVTIVSTLAGFSSVALAGENARAPVILSGLLLAMGLIKAVMSWNYVPISYNVIFSAILIAMPIVGGKLKGTIFI